MFKNIIVYLTIIAIFFNLIFSYPIYSVSTTCPSNLDPSSAACLAYLQKQAEILRNQKSNLKGKISQENYNQLSLQEKINYIDGQIASSENQIKQLELQLETKNVEIRILAKDILELQNNVDTVSQEVGTLENAIEKRMTLTYKYSFITPLEIFLESSNFDSLLRRFKYLTETRKKDKVLLSELSTKAKSLKDEELVLANKKSDVEKKRAEIEKTKTELYAETVSLTSQRGTKSNLLAISRQKEAEYNSNVNTLNRQEGKIASQISNIIFNLYKKGTLKTDTPVKKGAIVGYQGHTGYAYGSHLHFELRKNGSIINPYTSGYFKKYSGSGSARFPMDNAVVSFPHWDGSSAVDMHSANDYLYGSTDYYVSKRISCYGLPAIPAGQYYTLKGEGAPLYALKDGNISRVFIDDCGGKAVIIDYGGGLTSMYLHLR